jgi:hypothetical protein
MLDIDGVLNHQEAYQNKECSFDFNNKYQKFAPKSKELLNQLIEKTGAKLVISSTWRSDGIERMQEIFELEGVVGDIVGLTPHYSIPGYGSAPRGLEIESYLKSKKFWHINWSKDEQRKYMDASGIENYIILDDDSDMLYGQRNHFINVLPAPRNLSGFNEHYYAQSLETLSSNIIDLNYK